MEKIAILGWGSLLWDERAGFDDLHEPWKFDGPSLKIEFSRISKSRLGALTLVIDPDNGCTTAVAYCLSRRSEIGQIIEDLRDREGRGSRIGHFSKDGDSQFRDRATYDAIAAWAVSKALNGVVWTDLRPNFAKETGKLFSIENALDYLAGLGDEARIKAMEYLQKAPDFVQTPMRKAWDKQIGIDSYY